MSEGLDLAALRGRIVVLEFWGTYCAPCIAAIPHWNELVDHFAGSDIAFVSISDEDRAVVERFLRRRAIKGRVVVDAERTLFERYSIQALPSTVILDRSGVEIASTDLEAIDEQVLQSLLDGEPVTLPAMDRQALVPLADRLAGAADVEALYEVRIAPRAQAEYAATSAGAGWLKGEGWTVRRAIAYASHVNERHVDISEPLASTLVDVLIRLPATYAGTVEQTLLDGLTSAFNVEVQRRTSEKDVWVLTLPSGPGSGLRPTAAAGESSYMSTEDGLISGVNQSLAQLARKMEQILSVTVLDESGNTDGFDFELRYDAADDQSILSAAHAQLGIQLTQTRRAIETIVVRPRS